MSARRRYRAGSCGLVWLLHSDANPAARGDTIFVANKSEAHYPVRSSIAAACEQFKDKSKFSSLQVCKVLAQHHCPRCDLQCFVFGAEFSGLTESVPVALWKGLWSFLREGSLEGPAPGCGGRGFCWRVQCCVHTDNAICLHACSGRLKCKRKPPSHPGGYEGGFLPAPTTEREPRGSLRVRLRCRAFFRVELPGSIGHSRWHNDTRVAECMQVAGVADGSRRAVSPTRRCA